MRPGSQPIPLACCNWVGKVKGPKGILFCSGKDFWFEQEALYSEATCLDSGLLAWESSPLSHGVCNSPALWVGGFKEMISE